MLSHQSLFQRSLILSYGYPSQVRKPRGTSLRACFPLPSSLQLGEMKCQLRPVNCDSPIIRLALHFSLDAPLEIPRGKLPREVLVVPQRC